jgi:hypothetical protein
MNKDGTCTIFSGVLTSGNQRRLHMSDCG